MLRHISNEKETKQIEELKALVDRLTECLLLINWRLQFGASQIVSLRDSLFAF